MSTAIKEKKSFLRRFFTKRLSFKSPSRPRLWRGEGEGPGQTRPFEGYEKERLETIVAAVELIIPQKEELTTANVGEVLGMLCDGVADICRRRAFDFRSPEGGLIVGAYKLSPCAWIIKRQALIEYLRRINS